MPSLSTKSGVYHARFWYAGRQYRRTLKTNSPREAEGALYAIKSLLCRLETGALEIPPGVDPGDFIVSGGTLRASHGRAQGRGHGRFTGQSWMTARLQWFLSSSRANRYGSAPALT